MGVFFVDTQEIHGITGDFCRQGTVYGKNYKNDCQIIIGSDSPNVFLISPYSF